MIRTLISISIAVAVSFTSAMWAHGAPTDPSGAVFVMTNSAGRNEVISYARAENGSLRKVGAFETGGRGSGGLTDPLESQGSLILSPDHSFLYAVNAGSGTVSAFRVDRAWLSLVDVVPSGGSQPNALAEHGDLLYVLNAGGSSGVVGFRVGEGGRLRQIANSIRFLSTNTSGAASLSFSPDGRLLAVTERLTNDIDVFAVNDAGTLSPVVINSDQAPGTFAIAFAPNGAAVVVETGPAGANNGSTISSYAILSDGAIFPVSLGFPTLGAATCWTAITPDGRFVYTDNAGSSTISGFSIANDGSLTALPGTVQASNPSGSTNLDLAISADGKFLYSLNAGGGTIGIFAIGTEGSLTADGLVSGLAAGAGMNGIAAF